MQAVILAGWKMTQEKNISDSMVEISGRPFMEYQIDLLKEKGIDNIIVCPGYLGENMHFYFNKGADFGITLYYAKIEARKYGTGGGIKKVLPNLSDEFFILFGDSYFPVNYSSIMYTFKKSGKSGLMIIKKNYNPKIKGGIILEKNLVKEYIPNDCKLNANYLYSNACIMKKKVFELFFGEEFITLENMLQQLIVKEEIIGYEACEENIEICSLDGLEKFKQYLETK